MSSALLWLYLLDDEGEHEERRSTLRSLRDSSDPFDMADSYFEASFRLPKEACMSLIFELQPFDRQPTSLPFGVRFFSTLYFFANGSYQKCVGNNYVVPISQPSVSRSLNYIAALITKHKALEISFPTTNPKKLAIKAGFYSKFGIKGTIGAIDCTHISIICPPKNDPEKPCSLYMNRKGTYSLNVEAVCDDNLKILAFNASFPGSVHDSGIWSTSRVRAYMSSQQGSWLLGDQGYPLETWLMTPLSATSTRQELKYNKTHCKARNVIERCFGVLKSRFRCLSKHRTLHYSPETVAMISNACAILHNIMIARFPNSEIDIDENNSDEDGDVQGVENSNSNLHTEGERIRQSIMRNL